MLRIDPCSIFVQFSPIIATLNVLDIMICMTTAYIVIDLEAVNFDM